MIYCLSIFFGMVQHFERALVGLGLKPKKKHSEIRCQTWSITKVIYQRVPCVLEIAGLDHTKLGSNIDISQLPKLI